MSLQDLMRPAAVFLATGLLPLAVSQARAESTSLTSPLTSNVIVLPGDTTSDNNDANFDLFGDFSVEGADPLGAQAVTALSHVGSGLSSGWLVGGTLGAAAGVAGLVSGHGSGVPQLRSPSTTPGLPAAVGFGSSVPVNGVTGSAAPVNSVPGSAVNVNSVPGSAVNVNSVPGSSAPANIIVNGSTPMQSVADSGISGPGVTNFQAVTPEPGSIALLGGLGMMLTAVKMRRRKR